MMWHDPPLYLHFFDRELGQSVGFTLTAKRAESLLKCLLLGTTSRFYAALSPAWESPSMQGDLPHFISLLRQAQAIDFVSNYATVDEFLSSRLPLYRHDAARYPMYFSPTVRTTSQLIIPTQFKSISATDDLTRTLATWASNGVSRLAAAPDGALEKAIAQCVLRSLSHRNTEAITYSLFANELSELHAQIIAEGILRRKISTGYTQHYINFGGADIATGIIGLQYFEYLANRFPIFDIIPLATILDAIGFQEALQAPWQDKKVFWFNTLEKRNSTLHSLLRREITLLLEALAKTAIETNDPLETYKFEIRQNIVSILQNAIATLGTPKRRREGGFERSLEIIGNLIAILGRDPTTRRNIEQVSMQRNIDQCDVLLVVATQIEREALLKRCTEMSGTKYEPRFGARRTYFDLGHIGGARLLLVQCEKGSVAPGASLATVADAIDDLRPHCVLMVGIAFGISPDKQRIGEILVSHQLQSYELQRVGTDDHEGIKIKSRGDKVTASTKLLGRLRAATAGRTGSQVHFGLMLSGEKLVDNVDFRDQLKAFEGEALGGEMEGAGLYTAASERKVDWIVVKAICDWADGKKKIKKEERQRLAASASAEFILDAIARGGFGAIAGR